MVRAIDAFVDMLDLASFQFTYFELNQQGRPPFHPSTMMKIYFYGYQNGIRSCRQLEKPCRTNVEMMWLIHEQYPDYFWQRQQIIEHQFGTLKRHQHFDYTLMKGKENVLGEVYLAFTMYNLR